MTEDIQVSLILACDFSFQQYEEILQQTLDLPMLSAYKIGFTMALEAGLPSIVEVTRKYTDKLIIYDHQKAATDIPATGTLFAKTMRHSGVDAVILFPQSGPETQLAWTEAALENDLKVIVGGCMTHPKYLRSHGGYINDDAMIEIYRYAIDLCITDYVVPGNAPNTIRQIRQIIEKEGIKPVFYSPGLFTQKGDPIQALQAAGNSWNAIIGRSIYQSVNPRKSIEEIWSRVEKYIANLD